MDRDNALARLGRMRVIRSLPSASLRMISMVPRFLCFWLLSALVASVFVASSAFSAQRVDVTSMGAVGDGVTLNTAALQTAIDRCSADGGGTVFVPAGRYVTGTIQLKEGVMLHLEREAVLLGSTRAADYVNVDPFMAGDGIPQGYALVVAMDAKNVGIEGAGTIDGRGKEVKAAQEKYTVRPFLIRWVRCSEVTVKNVHLANPGAWTLNFFQCRNVVVTGVTIRSKGLINNDGIDTDSCQGVRISGCDVDSGDDAICMKATSTVACRDVEVTDCRLKTDCNAIKLGTESIGDFESIRVSRCRVREIGMAGIALYSVDGSHLHDVALNEITMDGVAVPISVRLGARLKTFRTGDQPKPPGTLRDITIKDVRVTGAKLIGILVNGIPGHAVENLRLENIDLGLSGGGTADQANVQLAEKESAYPEMRMFGSVMPAYALYVRHARGIHFANVRTSLKNPDARPASVFIDAEDVTPNNFSPAAEQPSATIARPRAASAAGLIASPDGKLVVQFQLGAGDAMTYEVRKNGAIVLQESKLGLVRDDADFSKELRLLGESDAESVTDTYELLTGKRRLNTYRAIRKVFHLAASKSQKLDVIFQVSNDGVGFRYSFPDTVPAGSLIRSEASSFHMPAGTLAWLQPMSVAKSGWKATNPSYEEYYAQGIPVGTPSLLGAGWAYPGLFKTGDTWLLVSEGTLGRGDCGTRLSHESPDGEYTVSFPDSRETIGAEPINPRPGSGWQSPWRFVAIGDLKAIAESTLGVDLATPAKVATTPALKPGKASWSWPLLGDKQTTYEVQKRFVDYAAEMGWAYCLIDAVWDKQIGYDKMQELAAYAAAKNVGLLLWYNSNGNWNDAPQTPKNRLLTHESRVQEFERLKAMGIKGCKVDFFGGDGRPVIDYYLDILEDAATYGLLMNFHGATLPRGWQRAYPNLMTMEAIRGFEFITFEQENADKEPTHAAMLPFTRNVFDPMDFTPVCLDKIGRVQRRTTSAFELALAVLFTSGIQHYAEIPEGMAKMPEYVRSVMRTIPSVWEDTRFIDGFPGKFAVLARKGEGHWYVAGINGEASAKTVKLDLSEIGATGKAKLITDGSGAEGTLFEQRSMQWSAGQKLDVALKPNGGFVIVVD